MYRCRGSPTCLHGRHLCDGIAQCPQHDDEVFCKLRCHEHCTCRGLAFFCSRSFPAAHFPQLKFLDARKSGMALSDLDNNPLLLYLGLAVCGIHTFTKLSLPNLLVLDVRDNFISEIRFDAVTECVSLADVRLAGNPLVQGFGVFNVTLASVRLLDLSRMHLADIDIRIFGMFPNLRTLNLSFCGVKVIKGGGFAEVTRLAHLDVRGCSEISVPKDILRGLNHLESVHSETFKLCCPQALPRNFDLRKCSAPRDPVSSCDRLLASEGHRFLVAMMSALTVCGSVGCVFCRWLQGRGKHNFCYFLDLFLIKIIHAVANEMPPLWKYHSHSLSRFPPFGSFTGLY